MVGNPRQQPPENLPITTDPTVSPPGIGEIARRVVFVHHDIALKTRAAVASLEQIVAENRVFGEDTAAVLKGIDIVDTLADERPLVEEILVEIGDNTGVGIDPGIARGHAAEPRPLGAREPYRHPGLENAVPLYDPRQRRVECRAIEDVSHGPDHVSGGVAWQVGVGVERDHIADLCQEPNVASHVGEPPIGACESRAADDRVDVGQFAAFAFPSHPDTIP